MRALHAAEDLHLAAALGEAEEERRRAVDAGGLRVGQILADLGGVAVALHALLEGVRLEAGFLRVAREIPGGERLLVAEELLVHLPVLALVAGALGSGGRAEG